MLTGICATFVTTILQLLHNVTHSSYREAKYPQKKASYCLPVYGMCAMLQLSNAIRDAAIGVLAVVRDQLVQLLQGCRSYASHVVPNVAQQCIDEVLLRCTHMHLWGVLWVVGIHKAARKHFHFVPHLFTVLTV